MTPKLKTKYSNIQRLLNQEDLCFLQCSWCMIVNEVWQRSQYSQHIPLHHSTWPSNATGSHFNSQKAQGHLEGIKLLIPCILQCVYFMHAGKVVCTILCRSLLKIKGLTLQKQHMSVIPGRWEIEAVGVL
jgi:hypothetical protein